MPHNATEHTPKDFHSEAIKSEKIAILNKVLESASFDGWKDVALENASQALGQAATYGYVYFPNGIADVAAFYVQTVDERMRDAFAAKDWSGLKVREKIRDAVLIRLELYNEHKEAVHSLTNFYAHPQHTAQGAAAIWRTVDAMWYAAGDTATDYNYYTKRGLLYAVYTATVLYWLKDDTESMEKTKVFLDKRINDVMQIEKAKGKVKGLFDKFAKVW